jgi:NAD-dependent DNA ligase
MKNPVHRYLMCSYAYYQMDESILPDAEFDALAKQLLNEYDKWKDHPHCPTEDDLRAGTYLGDFPMIVEIATQIYLKGSVSA